MATQLPALAEVTQVSTNVMRILGGNPGKFTLQGTNTYLLGSGPARILIDTGEGKPAWRQLLSRLLKEHNATVTMCVLSHWHHDHVLGVPDLLELCPEVKIHKCMPKLCQYEVMKDEWNVRDIKDGDTFAVLDDETEFEVQAIHCPGHTEDHMAFVVTKSSDESEIGSLFTADNVLGHGTAVFENLSIYLHSLALMKERLASGKRAYPGHGDVIEDGRARVQMYMDHRKMREDEALNVLRFGRTTRPSESDIMGKEIMAKEWASMEIVKVIYANVPENLHEPAEKGLLMVLEKLRAEGKVVKSQDEQRWRISEKAIL